MVEVYLWLFYCVGFFGSYFVITKIFHPLLGVGDETKKEEEAIHEELKDLEEEM